MLSYKSLNWRDPGRNLTAAEIDALALEEAGINEENDKIFRDAVERFKAAKATIRDIFGDCRQSRYIEAQLSVPSPRRCVRAANIREAQAKAVADEKKKADDNARKLAEDARTGKAIQYLLTEGYALGVDYALDRAVYFANDIAGMKAVESKKQACAATPQLFDFHGKNCDECEGWDGLSRRCQCGNRRVDWECHSDFDQDAYVIGVAY